MRFLPSLSLGFMIQTLFLSLLYLYKQDLGSKRKRTKEYDEDGEEDERKGGSRGGSSFGSEYKAKRAGGDVKRKGKPDPYAYLPLNRSSLNKRYGLSEAYSYS